MGHQIFSLTVVESIVSHPGVTFSQHQCILVQMRDNPGIRRHQLQGCQPLKKGSGQLKRKNPNQKKQSKGEFIELLITEFNTEQSSRGYVIAL